MIERQATHDIAAYLSVPAAIEYQRDHNWRSVREECHQLVRLARQKMAAVTGVEPPVADDARWFAQMASLPLPRGTDAAALKERLYDEHRVEIPTSHWGEAPGLRVSVQGYNTRSDIDRLVSAVEATLTER
jgi:isopenicillin-N epimerase